ncbi:hypothetical protein HDU67_009576 [Dinochytrium kinnereticum]|nr:hypothetical protein HDU67_009576 [Dinochytrium kinnereticum]
MMHQEKPLFTIDSFQHKRASSSHTQPAQRQAILEWLETQDNFALLATPTAVRTSAAETGIKLKKTDGYRSLAEYVNRRTGSDWTPQIAKSRFESFMKIYRRTSIEFKSPHFGLSAEDFKRGVDDIQKKLNDMCPCYDRIDRLAKDLNLSGLDLDGVVVGRGSDADSEVVSAIDQVVNEISMVANGTSVSLAEDDAAHNGSMLALVGSSPKNPTIKWMNNPGPSPLRHAPPTTGQKRVRDDVVVLDPTSPASSSSSNHVPNTGSNSSLTSNVVGIANSPSSNSMTSEPKSKLPKLSNATPSSRDTPPGFVTPERFGLIKDPKDARGASSTGLMDPKGTREAQIKELEIKWQELELKRRECEVREREVELRKMELEYESSMKMKKMKADILLTLLGEGKTDEQIAKYFELFN